MSRLDAHLYDTSLKYVSDYGRELITMLAPHTGEYIVDLGCGTGDLCHEIEKSGANVLGLDSSESMIARAREKYPKSEFLVADLRNFDLMKPADAFLSNATMHFVTDQEQALNQIYSNLKPGGRFIAEMGGRGNVATILDCMVEAIKEAGFLARKREEVFFFPSVGEYALLLEKCGFRVNQCFFFERPTHLLSGLEDFRIWIRVLGIPFFESIPMHQHEGIIESAVGKMAGKLQKDSRYFADYVRLRFHASKG